MRRPFIGIAPCLDDRGRWRADHHYQYLDRRYADALERAGATPLLLPIQSDVDAPLEVLDGLLLPGGDDLPSETPLPPEVELDLVPEAQLAFDRALVEAARQRRLPVLGICYGMQLLALTGGGRLHGHLPTARPEAAEHRLRAPEARHEIRIEPGSALAEALGTERCAVNSLHHQAVRSPGPRHRAVAWSADGVIEAIEMEPPRCAAAAFELGVQWHPEKMDGTSSDRLFAWFVARCRDRQRTAGGGGRTA